jgi:hypothetical protein
MVDDVVVVPFDALDDVTQDDQDDEDSLQGV